MPRGIVSHTSANKASPKNIDAIGIETGSLPTGSVSTAELADDAVTAPKIAGAPTAGTYTQTFSTADKTHAADGSADLATTAATQTSPWGFATQAQAEAIATQVNALRATVADLKQLANSVIDDLQALGLVT